jgi:predicted RNA-binding Zn ribbon-like protein
MRFEHGANLGAVRAAELANRAAAGTLDADAFVEFYEVRAFGDTLDDDTVADLQRLGNDLGAVFAAADPREVVNAMLAEVEIRPHVTDHDDRGAHLHYEAPDASLVDRVRANTLMGLAVLLCDDHDRIGTCDATGCDRAWVDTSRNARRRFCSSQCANRTHVAAHRARARAHRATADAGA